VERFGKVDVLVNNAGVLRAVPIPNMTEDIYREVIDVNQIAVFLGMKAVVGPMVAAGGGSIVNISSIDGHQGTPTLVAYVAAKYAVCGMTRVAALELASVGIRANTVCPGATRTRMMDAPDMAGVDIEAMSARMAPCSAYSVLMAAPIPRAPPVTIATLPASRSPMSGPAFWVGECSVAWDGEISWSCG
jgi:3alpha(or 20beta)-hydroxysteroid dehydrogenase